MVRRLRVHRKGYHRRGYTRKDGVRVKACYVPPTTYYIKDRGAPGRGRKVLPELREDKMTIDYKVPASDILAAIRRHYKRRHPRRFRQQIRKALRTKRKRGIINKRGR